MMFLLQLTPGLLAVALAASLAACGSQSDPTLDSTVAPQGQVVANDCRSPNAQTTQRGCKPVTRMIATQ
jgi:hypothetical protein